MYKPFPISNIQFINTKFMGKGNGDRYILFVRLGKRGNPRCFSVTIICHYKKQVIHLAESIGENVPVLGC